ncbi:MAG: citramalate synthase [Polyangiales bacterium]
MSRLMAAASEDARSPAPSAAGAGDAVAAQAVVAAQAAVEIYDTTLRDGTQGEGVNLSCSDKVAIAQRLDALGVHFIEGGFPGSNPKDEEFFARVRDLDWQHATVCAFGATRRASLRASDDPGLTRLLAAGTRVCTLFGKSWTLHVEDVLCISLEENLRLIEDSVARLCSEGRQVIYDAEHFFDGYRADPVYALATLQAAVQGGAQTVVLCDTNGGSLPWDVESVVRAVCAALVEVRVGVHTHDDGGVAVANALSAVRAGAGQVQGTINGLGERCGNANLCTVIPDLSLKLGRPCLPTGKLKELSQVARYVAEVANLPLTGQAPYVGRSAFAHKGGVHVAAMRRHAGSYQHIDPEQVGNQSRVLVSDLSGRGNVLSLAEQLQMRASPEQAAGLVQQIKDSEAQGFAFEAAEASVAMMMHRSQAGHAPLFVVRDYQTTVGRRPGCTMFCEGTIKVDIDGATEHTAADGNGPVSALAGALRKALAPVWPAVADIALCDYKVRILEASAGTEARIRVLITLRHGARQWRTVGASTNIIEASLIALVDGLEYGLLFVVPQSKPDVARPEGKAPSAAAPSATPAADEAPAKGG